MPALTLVPDEGRKQLSDVTLDLEDPPNEDLPKVEPPKVERTAAGGQPARREGRPGAQRLAEAERPADLERQAARRSMGNVRDAIAALGDNALPRPMPSVIPELKAAVIPTARPVVRQGPRAAVTFPVAPAIPAAASDTQAAHDSAQLTDTATLRLLENGSPEKHPAVVRRPSAPPAKAWYAVQLIWSVQPITTTQIPQLAIFGAYTLYGAEGNRDGRRWYGLRLGFFTDAVSAKQVAHYVRGDFATVSVVPVTVRERDQALQAVARAASGASVPAHAAATGNIGSAGVSVEATATAPATAGPVTTVTAAGALHGATPSAAPRPKEPQFAFIEGTEPPKKGRGSGAASPAAGHPTGASRPGGRPTRGAPGKRAKPRPPGQIHARTHTKPKTLEETLEILGAGELRVDDDPAGLLKDSGLRQMKLEPSKAKPSKLSRLIDRLSERMGS